ncbi:MAG: gntR [Chloroflexi bacterium]|nr:gntR [Chloroflexota bacterium]
MPIRAAESRAHHIFRVIRDRIQAGEWLPGTRLPSNAELASTFGVARMTVRQALASLEADGLIQGRQGTGTFVRSNETAAVLVVDDDPSIRLLLRETIKRDGYRVLEADGPTAAIRQIEGDVSIALVLSDVRMPTAAIGIDFMRTVRRRWPGLPIAALTAYPGDLENLINTPEGPVLVLSKPIHMSQIDEVLRLAMRTARSTEDSNALRPPEPEGSVPPRLGGGPAEPESRPVLVADDDPDHRSSLGRMIARLGYEVEEAANAGDAIAALGRRSFSHAFLDLHMPGGRSRVAAAMGDNLASTVVVSTARRTGIRSGSPITFLPKPIDEEMVRATLALQSIPAEA